MIELQGFSGKAVGVFGLARSGLSAARALKLAGAKVFAWDDTESSRLAALKDGFPSESVERWPWREMSSLVLSPGIPLTHPKPHAIVRRRMAFRFVDSE